MQIYMLPKCKFTSHNMQIVYYKLIYAAHYELLVATNYASLLRLKSQDQSKSQVTVINLNYI